MLLVLNSFTKNLSMAKSKYLMPEMFKAIISYTLKMAEKFATFPSLVIALGKAHTALPLCI